MPSSEITGLFVGGPCHGEIRALQRAFKTTGFIEWDGTRNVKIHYDLDLDHFEPYVYVERGLKARDRDREHEDALRIVRGGRKHFVIGRRGSPDFLNGWANGR